MSVIITKFQKIMAMIILFIILNSAVPFLAPSANAFKLKNCSVDTDPRGVAAFNASTIWVAISGGELQEFTNSNNDCTNTKITVNNDPDFINETSTGLVAFTNHLFNKISYYDTSTGDTISCSNSLFNEPDDIITYGGAQYFSSYNNGYEVKSVKSGSTCNITTYAVPGPHSNPEGLAYSGQGSALFVVDNFNNKMYLFYPSTGTFSLFYDFNTLVGSVYDHPWYIAVDTKDSIVWVTFYNDKLVRAFGILSNLLVSTSPTTTGFPFDVALSGNYDPIFTYGDIPKVGTFDTQSGLISDDDWSNVCSTCNGFGIDVDGRTGKYYASMQTGNTPQLVIGATPCDPIISGTWTIDRGCTIIPDTSLNSNVTVTNNSVLTILGGTTLHISLNSHKLLVNPGSGILINPGGKIGP
jgi:hypothetical protein